jgi:flagellar protein FlaG
MSDLQLNITDSSIVTPLKEHISITAETTQNIQPSNLETAKKEKDVNDIKTNKNEKVLTESEREKIKEQSDKLFDALNTGLALKFHEKSGEWYAVIENKITQEVIKEVPPKFMLDLEAKLKNMIGIFLDKKI